MSIRKSRISQLGLWLRASQALMLHLVGKCTISTWAWVLAIILGDGFNYSLSNVILVDEKIHFIPSISEILSQMWYHCVQYTRRHHIQPNLTLLAPFPAKQAVQTTSRINSMLK